MHTSLRATFPVTTLLLLGASAEPASAQMRFSTDWNGASVGTTGCDGATLTEGDLLAPCSGYPELHAVSPSVAVSGGIPGLRLAGYGACAGSPGGTGCGIELDALSSGRDRPFWPNEQVAPAALLFSVDAYATGLPGVPAPSVTSERAAFEAAADLFGNLSALPPGALGPAAVAPGNIGVIDGDGYPSTSAEWYPGLGLAEPTWVTFAPNAASNGDDLDAFDDAQVSPSDGGGLYFSLDSAFVDPCSGHPNTGSAAANGFSGADVLKRTPGGPVMYAPAAALGLDAFGVGTDDLDALLLHDNGDGVFQPSYELYGWTSGTTDMLLFSVRRGSAVIGRPDSLTGTPIEEGDILMPPVGGLSPFPSIFIAAENLGLLTVRSGGVTINCNNGDDLDALDRSEQPIFDCNENGIEDAIDIATGASDDDDQNSVPDECEPGLISSLYCFCDGNDAPAPCGNIYVAGGCENSTGEGAGLSLFGTSSVADDDLTILMKRMPTSTFGILFMGDAQISPVNLGDGLRCVGGQICRFPVKNSGATGEIEYGPGFAAFTQANFAAGCWILPGSTWNFQGWFRDNSGLCGNGSNTTVAAAVTFY